MQDAFISGKRSARSKAERGTAAFNRMCCHDQVVQVRRLPHQHFLHGAEWKWNSALPFHSTLMPKHACMHVALGRVRLLVRGSPAVRGLREGHVLVERVRAILCTEEACMRATLAALGHRNGIRGAQQRSAACMSAWRPASSCAQCQLLAAGRRSATGQRGTGTTAPLEKQRKALHGRRADVRAHKQYAYRRK